MKKKLKKKIQKTKKGEREREREVGCKIVKALRRQFPPLSEGG